MQYKPNNHPANSIRHAYSRYEYVSANIQEGEKIGCASPICRGNAYLKSCSKRKRKY
jgi:hypothetical protein